MVSSRARSPSHRSTTANKTPFVSIRRHQLLIMYNSARFTGLRWLMSTLFSLANARILVSARLDGLLNVLPARLPVQFVSMRMAARLFEAEIIQTAPASITVELVS